MDPQVVAESDRGVPVVEARPDCAASQAYREIARAVGATLEQAAAPRPPGLSSFIDRFRGR
jgi:MinD-like ATPase involved in chromosome partitioning or flagellar assembly